MKCLVSRLGYNSCRIAGLAVSVPVASGSLWSGICAVVGAVSVMKPCTVPALLQTRRTEIPQPFSHTLSQGNPHYEWESRLPGAALELWNRYRWFEFPEMFVSQPCYDQCSLPPFLGRLSNHQNTRVETPGRCWPAPIIWVSIFIPAEPEMVHASRIGER